MRKYHMVVEQQDTGSRGQHCWLALKEAAPTCAMERLIRQIISVAEQNLAVDMDGLEKESVRLRRHVSQREKEVELLRSKLRLRLSAERR